MMMRRTEAYIRSTATTVVTYGIDTHSDVMAKDIVMTSGGTTFTLVTPHESKKITMKLIGKFNVYNALAATAKRTCIWCISANNHRCFRTFNWCCRPI